MYRMVFIRVGLLVSVLVATLIASSPSRALIITPTARWEHGSYAHFRIDPNIGNQLHNSAGGLGVPGTVGEVRASQYAWNDSTAFNFVEAGWTAQIGAPVRAQNLDVRGSLLSNQCIRDAIAIACTLTIGTSFQSIETVINANPRYRFHADSTNRRKVGTAYSIYNTGRHEFGHWIGLDDEYLYTNGERNSTMWDGELGVQEADLRGVAMWYGPFTGFDSNNRTASGVTYPNSDPKYAPGLRNVANFYNNAGTMPELGPVFPSTETAYNNIQPLPGTGDRMERFAGTSRSTSAIAYYRLFTLEDDRNKRATTKIVDGSILKWCQYNYQQTTMSVDADLVPVAGLPASLRDYTNTVIASPATHTSRRSMTHAL